MLSPYTWYRVVSPSDSRPTGCKHLSQMTKHSLPQHSLLVCWCLLYQQESLVSSQTQSHKLSPSFPGSMTDYFLPLGAAIQSQRSVSLTETHLNSPLALCAHFQLAHIGSAPVFSRTRDFQRRDIFYPGFSCVLNCAFSLIKIAYGIDSKI